MNLGAGYQLAVDLGAGSGRVMALAMEGGLPVLTEVHRFAGEPVNTPDGVHWNLLQTLVDIRRGIALARERFGGPARSLAVDSWGVDYALLDARGGMLGAPYFYRDTRTDGRDGVLRGRLPDAELFRRTGSQPRQINTIYQLLAEQTQRPEALAAARRIAFVPDLINYWLTGVYSHENTIAATSGLWDPATRDWNRGLIAELGLPERIFEPLQEPGTRVGTCDGVPVLLCASHDTASAIHAVQGEPGQVILSLGSWAIVSWALTEPGLSAAAGAAGFAVEGCPAGSWRYARNHTGLWIMQRYRLALGGETNTPPGFAELEEAAKGARTVEAVINPDDPAFSHPEDMAVALRNRLSEQGGELPGSPGEWVRMIYRSLALSFARSIRDLEGVTGEPARSIRVIGGGAQSELLCEMIAAECGLPLVAGPVEATAWGNFLAQVKEVQGGSDMDWRRAFSGTWAERSYGPHVLGGRPLAEPRGVDPKRI